MRAIGIAVLLVIACAASAQNQTGSPDRAGLAIWEPPTLDIPDTLSRATVPKEMIATLRVANLQIILEKTALTNVQKQLGGIIGQRGDASEALEWLCFYGTDSNGRWALWLESSEMGGGAVDGFALQRINRNARPDRRCHGFGKSDGGAELPVALRLGQTETQVREILGKPTIRYGNTLIFDHEHEETIRSEPFTASNTVYIALRRGVVWALQVWKTTSN